LKWTPFVAPAATGPTWYSENTVDVPREEGKNHAAVKALWVCCLMGNETHMHAYKTSLWWEYLCIYRVCVNINIL
jgi:hypothetical protein